MTTPEQPKLTPEVAAEIVAALKAGNAIVCYVKCWPCQSGQCANWPHTWMDDEDAEHAGVGHVSPAELAVSHPCGCHCNARSEAEHA